MVTLVCGGVPHPHPDVIDRAEYGVCFKSRGRINTGKFSSWRAAFKVQLPRKMNLPEPGDFCDPGYSNVALGRGPEAAPGANTSKGSPSNPHWPTWERDIRAKVRRYYSRVNQEGGSDIVGPRACYNGQLLYGNYLKLRGGLIRQITTDRQTVEMLIPAETEPRRKRRSIFSWLGKAIGSAFGWTTTEQLREVEQSVRELGGQTGRNRGDIIENRKLLMALTEIVDNSTDVLTGRIGEIQEHLGEMTHVVRNLTFAMAAYTDYRVAMLADFAKNTRILLHKTSLYAGLELQALSQVKRRSRELVAAAQKVMNHRLPTELVSPMRLATMLRAITKFIEQSYGGYRLVYETPEYYYTSGSIEYMRRGDTLILGLRVPVTRIDTMFTLYEVLSYIAPVQDSVNKSRVVGTRVEHLPDMLAVSDDGSYYIEMKRHEWLECSGSRVKICPSLPPLRERTLMACTLALFEGLKDVVADKCHVVYYPRLSHIPPQVMSLGGGEYIIVTNSQTWTKTCQNHAPISVRAGLHSRVKLDCDCSLTMEGLYLPPNLENCAEPTMFTISQVHNRPFEEAFYNISSAKLDTRTPVTKQGDLARMKAGLLPKLEIYVPDRTDPRQDFSKFKVKLSEAIEAVREDKPVFMHAQDKVEYMSKNYMSISLTDKVTAILALYATVASTVGLIGLCLLVKRTRSNAVWLSAASMLPAVRAAGNMGEHCGGATPLEIMGYISVIGAAAYMCYWIRNRVAEYFARKYDCCKARRYASMGHTRSGAYDLIVEMKVGEVKAWIYLCSSSSNLAACQIEGDLKGIIRGTDESGRLPRIEWNFDNIKMWRNGAQDDVLKTVRASTLTSSRDRWVLRYIAHPDLRVALMVSGDNGLTCLPPVGESE